MLKKVCSLLLAATMIMWAGSAFTVNAAENDKPIHTPKVSTLTLKTDNNVSKYFNADGEEVDVSNLNTGVLSRRRVALPTTFDLRDEGRSTSVKDQGSYGFCWSFASIASMESNILTQNIGNATIENLDLSESGGAWFSCNGVTDESDSTFGDHRDDPYNGTAGGNAIYAAESISSGYGAYPEELARYSDVSDGYNEALRYYSDYRFKDLSFLPEDINLIKQCIMEKGAMYCAYKCFMDNYYETDDGECTYSDNGKSIYGEDTDGGHAVTIVGWDDNFSKDNFHPDAGVKNDGAWLVKNSWGDYWGNDGYFWVSYESFWYEFGQFEMQDKDSFDTIHQHQTSSEQYLFGGTDEESPQYFSSANVFTANTEEQLKQICYTNAVNSNVKVKIYELDRGYESPVDGMLLAEFDSNVLYAGTHCLDVPENIIFNKGDIFSVVIEGEALMTNFRYEDAEHPVNDKAGKSFFTDNGADWTDVADFADASYAAIKAYTTKTSVDKTELANVLKGIKEFKPSNEGEQYLYDKNKPLIEKAEKLLADDNATNTEIKNCCCVLKAASKGLKMEAFAINTIEDFKTFCKGVRAGEFDNKYVDLNTDLDLTDFDIEYIYTIDDDTGFGELIAHYFTATNVYFNGNGYTIRNLDALMNSTSLFGNLKDSTVKNLNIENCNTEGKNSRVSLLVGLAVNTRFNNINVKNSTVNANSITYSALIAGLSKSCTFMECNAENCKIIGGAIAGLFFADEDEIVHTQVIDCTAENYTIYGNYYIDDNMGFICTYPVKSEMDLVAVSIKVTDDDCVVKQFAAILESVKVNGVDITPVGSEYHIDKSNGPLSFEMEYSCYEAYDFSICPNPENYTTEITGYLGTDKDVVIPEKVYGLDVIGLGGVFTSFATMPSEINSVTIPGVVKYISDDCFIELSGLTKIVLNNGVQIIGANAFENCGKLTEISLPDSVQTIGEKAFINCGANSVTFGKNIQTIGDYAFGYMESDTDIVTPIEGFTIYGYSGTAAENYAQANGFNFVDLSV